MARRRKKNQPKIRSPLTPPKKAKLTGEVVRRDGVDHHVYRELKPPHQRSEVQEVVDPDTGRVRKRQDRHGNPTISVRTRVETIPKDSEEAFREFILEDLGNGTVVKNYGFREDPEKLRQREEEAKREAQREKLLDKLIDLPQDTVAAFLGRAGAEEIKNAGGEITPTEEEKAYGEKFEKRKRPDAPGWYDVIGPDGEPVNEKGLRAEEADAVIDSFATHPPMPEDDDE